MSEPIRLRGPSDVLAAIPSLLGFRPQGSVVLLALRPDGVVACAARADLPDLCDLDSWSRSFLPAVEHAGEVNAILAGFSVAQDDARLAACFAALHALLRERDCLVLDMIAVLGGRWRSAMCSDPECCPPDGWPVETLDEDFMRVRLGIREIASDRSDLVAEIEPRPESALRPEAIESLGALSEVERDEAIERTTAYLLADAPDAQCSTTALRDLRDVRVRDTVLWDVVHEHADDWPRVAQRLAEIVRSAPVGHVAPAATVLAVVRWQMGDGARARIALDRARADNPDYGLALLVEGMLDCGQPPWTWRAALAELPRAACRGA